MISWFVAFLRLKEAQRVWVIALFFVGSALQAQDVEVAGDGGGSASAEEIAQQLANPNTPLASLNFKLQYREFKGTLTGANGQSGTTLLFQPSLPFPLDNGDSILFRPAIPLQFDFPAPTAGPQNFDSKTGLGDITFDLAYAITTDSGLLIATGFVSTLPTATDDALGSDRITLGPELLIGKLTQTYVIGAFPNHQWDVGGSGNKDINVTSMQLFGTYLPGGGWNLGTSPILSYDHEIDEWTIPINFTFGKTIILGSRPWKLSAEINYYVKQPEVFGPDWFIGFNAAPVVENGFARWFR